MRCVACRALVATSDERCVCGFPLRFPVESIETPLQLGLVRESPADRTNDYTIFMEEWCFVHLHRPSPADILKAGDP